MQQSSGSDVDGENAEPQNNAEELEDSEHPTENNDEDAEQSSQNNEAEDQTDNGDSQETTGNEDEELRDRNAIRFFIENTDEGQNLLREISIKAVQLEEENTKAEIEQVLNASLYVDTNKEHRFIIIFTRTFNHPNI